MMKRALMKFLFRFRLRKHEDQPSSKLFLIYSAALGLLAAGGLIVGQLTNSPEIGFAARLALIGLLSYGLIVLVTFDNYMFLLHVEGVIKAILCLTLILWLRCYWLSSYGQPNRYEVIMAILFSIFGRGALINWFEKQKCVFEMMRKPKLHPNLLKTAEFLQQRSKRTPGE